jgi:hypothetical protein
MHFGNHFQFAKTLSRAGCIVADFKGAHFNLRYPLIKTWCGANPKTALVSIAKLSLHENLISRTFSELHVDGLIG